MCVFVCSFGHDKKIKKEDKDFSKTTRRERRKCQATHFHQKTGSFLDLLLVVNRFHLAILLAQVGNRVLEKDWVEANGRTDQWHVTEESHECIEARLSLKKVIRIVPRRSTVCVCLCAIVSPNVRFPSMQQQQQKRKQPLVNKTIQCVV